MKGISNEKGITFGELIEFVDNNRNELSEDIPIKLHVNHDEDNNNLRDICIMQDAEFIRMYNYI